MGEKKAFDFLVNGGEATAGPPIGPTLGPLGVNLLQIVNRINELTKEYAGMRVPVKVVIDLETKGFEVEVGIPTTSALVIKELGIEKGSSNPKQKIVGNLTMEKVVKIAKIRKAKSYAKTVKGVVKEVLGSCLSLGVNVEGKDPKQVVKEVEQGLWDQVLERD